MGKGGGALELTFGYPFIDLTDGNIRGGQAQTFIVGLNWYLHKHTKFMLNIGPAILQDPDTGFGTAFIGGARSGRVLSVSCRRFLSHTLDGDLFFFSKGSERFDEAGFCVGLQVENCRYVFNRYLTTLSRSHI